MAESADCRPSGNDPYGRRISLMALRFAPVTEEGVRHIIQAGIREGRGGWVCPLNVDTVRQCAADPGLRELVSSAEVVVADGMPLIWGSKLQGTPLPGRVAGSSLILSLPKSLSRSGGTVFLLGGNPGSAEGAAKRLRELYPSLTISGTLCPQFGFEKDPAAFDAILAALRSVSPDVTFVALGFPKQDRLIFALRERLPSTWFISCGISFSFVSGEVRRAPRWMQALGLEWVHRLHQEPRRLFRRYILQDIPFALKLLCLSASRRQGRTR